MNRQKLFVLMGALLIGNIVTGNAESKVPNPALDKETQNAIAIFKKTDSELEKLFKKSAGYAVFPTVAKGAIGIGGAHGAGQVYEKGKLIGTASLTQVTIGFQLGGQGYSEVIFFENKEALDNFKESKFALSAQVSAVAAAEGASSNAKYEQGVLVFTIAKTGLMYEASVGGQKFKFTPVK
jgi:lipid-binding SYLF domain-containing protein